jgi:hypothetical protein
MIGLDENGMVPEDEELTKFYKNFIGPRLSIFKMTHDERKRIMNANPPECTNIHHAVAYFDWSWIACGFGQLSFEQDPETGKFKFQNEGMSVESVRILLHAMADYIADNAEFEK